MIPVDSKLGGKIISDENRNVYYIPNRKTIERFKDISLEEFLKDDIIQDIVEYNLFI